MRIYSRAATLDFIDVSVEEDNGDMWRLTGIYDEPSWDNENRMYQLLWDLHAQSRLPWRVNGDFNEILFSSEKDGGAPGHQSHLQAFQDALCPTAPLKTWVMRETYSRGSVECCGKD